MGHPIETEQIPNRASDPTRGKAGFKAVIFEAQKQGHEREVGPEGVVEPGQGMVRVAGKGQREQGAAQDREQQAAVAERRDEIGQVALSSARVLRRWHGWWEGKIRSGIRREIYRLIAIIFSQLQSAIHFLRSPYYEE